MLNVPSAMKNAQQSAALFQLLLAGKDSTIFWGLRLLIKGQREM